MPGNVSGNQKTECHTPPLRAVQHGGSLKQRLHAVCCIAKWAPAASYLPLRDLFSMCGWKVQVDSSSRLRYSARFSWLRAARYACKGVRGTARGSDHTVRRRREVRVTASL